MGFFDRLKKGLSKSRGNLTERVDELVENTAVVDDDFYEELTDILIREALEDGAKGPATLVGRSETVLPSVADLERMAIEAEAAAMSVSITPACTTLTVMLRRPRSRAAPLL